MLLIPWGKNDAETGDDGIGAWRLMDFFVLCGVATRGASSMKVFALEEFACFEDS